MDQLRQVARGVGVALRLQSLLRFAGMPLVETSITAGVLARLQLLAAPALVRPDATVITLSVRTRRCSPCWLSTARRHVHA